MCNIYSRYRNTIRGFNPNSVARNGVELRATVRNGVELRATVQNGVELHATVRNCKPRNYNNFCLFFIRCKTKQVSANETISCKFKNKKITF